MPLRRRTYRIVDGARVEGTWRPVFIRNGNYYLTDLLIYADGKVDSWGLVDFEEFCAQVNSGWVATTFTPGALASAHMVASWRIADPVSAITPEELIAEVRDEINELRGEPTSGDRCLDALRHYLAAPGPGPLADLHAAYLAVPGHLRVFLLGDMDARDIPLRQLLTPAGQPLMGGDGGDKAEVVSEADKQDALSWFAEWTREATQEEQARWRDPERPATQRDVVRFTSGTRVVGVDPERGWLSPASPHPVTDSGVEWPTVLHAYLAASTLDPELIASLRACETARELFRLMQDAPRRERWPEMRLTEMARLLRLKFNQHPTLAARLIATGDSLLVGTSIMGSDFWDSRGQNWIGRLLELVRAELASAAGPAALHAAGPGQARPAGRPARRRDRCRRARPGQAADGELRELIQCIQPQAGPVPRPFHGGAVDLRRARISWELRSHSGCRPPRPPGR